MKKKLAIVLLVLVLPLAGCAQLHGLYDGITGAPVETVDNPTWYHVGQFILPVVSQIIAIVRRAWLGI